MRSIWIVLLNVALISLMSLGCSGCEPLTTLPQPSTSTIPTDPPAASREATPFSGLSTSAPNETPEASETPIPSPTSLEVVRFAVIGDFGQGNQAEADVASLVKSWNPDFIITVGDNNYPSGSAETIDANIGQYYHEFIYPYRGAYGDGADQLRFFPTLGNHDVDTDRGQPYLDYFELPGNERYYSFTWGPVFFLAINSDSREPDGVSPISTQAQWAQAELEKAESPWKVVYFHAAPYSSGYHGPVDWMRWDFAGWGASVVLSGHDHAYERLLVDGLTYIVSASGGGPIYDFLGAAEGSQFRYNDDYGAILATADAQQITLEFFNTKGERIDSFQLTK